MLDLFSSLPPPPPPTPFLFVGSDRQTGMATSESVKGAGDRGMLNVVMDSLVAGKQRKERAWRGVNGNRRQRGDDLGPFLYTGRPREHHLPRAPPPPPPHTHTHTNPLNNKGTEESGKRRRRLFAIHYQHTSRVLCCHREKFDISLLIHSTGGGCSSYHLDPTPPPPPPPPS